MYRHCYKASCINNLVTSFKCMIMLPMDPQLKSSWKEFWFDFLFVDKTFCKDLFSSYDEIGMYSSPY